MHGGNQWGQKGKSAFLAKGRKLSSMTSGGIKGGITSSRSAKQKKKQADTDPESKTQTHKHRQDMADKT